MAQPFPRGWTCPGAVAARLVVRGVVRHREGGGGGERARERGCRLRCGRGGAQETEGGGSSMAAASMTASDSVTDAARARAGNLDEKPARAISSYGAHVHINGCGDHEATDRAFDCGRACAHTIKF